MDIRGAITRGVDNTRQLASRARGYFAQQQAMRQTPEYQRFRQSIPSMVNKIDYTQYLPMGRAKMSQKMFRDVTDPQKMQAAQKAFNDDALLRRLRLEAESRLERLRLGEEARLSRENIARQWKNRTNFNATRGPQFNGNENLLRKFLQTIYR